MVIYHKYMFGTTCLWGFNDVRTKGKGGVGLGVGEKGFYRDVGKLLKLGRGLVFIVGLTKRRGVVQPGQ